MVVQVYITKKLRLIQTETRPFKLIKWGWRTKWILSLFKCQLASKLTYEVFGSTWNSVSNIYDVCLIRQIALNDEIGAFIGSFKLRLDLTNLDKYMIYFSTVKDFQVSTIQI